jgi:hypothetical protein
MKSRKRKRVWEREKYRYALYTKKRLWVRERVSKSVCMNNKLCIGFNINAYLYLHTLNSYAFSFPNKKKNRHITILDSDPIKVLHVPNRLVQDSGPKCQVLLSPVTVNHVNCVPFKKRAMSSCRQVICVFIRIPVHWNGHVLSLWKQILPFC